MTVSPTWVQFHIKWWSEDELSSMLAVKSPGFAAAPVLSAAVRAGVTVAIAVLAVIVASCVLIFFIILLAVLLNVKVVVNAMCAKIIIT